MYVLQLESGKLLPFEKTLDTKVACILSGISKSYK